MSAEDTNGPASRIIDLGSTSAKPFQVLIGVTAAGGIAPRFRLSIASGTRVCVFGRGVTIDAQNMHNSENQIAWSVSDGVIPTSNTYQIEYEGPAVAEILEVASYARRVRLEPANVAAVATLTFINGNGVTLAVWPWASIPSDGIPIGSTDRIQVDSTTACRVVYDLAL